MNARVQWAHFLQTICQLGPRNVFKERNDLNQLNFKYNYRQLFYIQHSPNFTLEIQGDRGKNILIRPILNMNKSGKPNHYQSNKYRWVNQKLQKPMDQDRLVWVDLEMTGLDLEKCHIIEIACIITDGQLNIVAEGPNIVIHQSEEILEAMNDWCKHHHGKSGLTEASRASTISLKTAEMEVLSFVRLHTPPFKCPLAGNSVHADKEFIEKYMPDLMKHLHYRIVDVSTVKELCRRWYPDEYKDAFTKKSSHRALDDIKESIEELKHYRKSIFK